MTRHGTGVSLVCLAVLCFAGRAFAQSPLGSGFTYQGQLNLSGSPVNDTADFEFTLWDAASGGNMIGSADGVDGVSVVDGLFTVPLDFGVAVFNGEARWLEVSVASPSGGSFTTLSPRQPLTAVPYSLQTRGIYVNSGGNVGIGTTTPGAKLGVEGDIRVSGKVLSSSGGLDLSGGGSGVNVLLDEDGGSNDTFIIYDTGVERFRVDGNSGTVTAPAFIGDGSGLTGIPGDDLGSHTATQALDMNSFDISNAATVTASAFFGDGSALTNVPGNNLGDHTATEALDMNSFDINNAGTVTGDAFSGDGSGLVGVNASTIASSTGMARIGRGLETYTWANSLDQEYAPFNVTATSSIGAWQSFTAGATGDLAAVDVYRRVFDGDSGVAADMRIYEGEGTAGPLLGVGSVPMASTVQDEWQTATLQSPVPIVAGNQYTIELVGNSQLWWGLDVAGTYDGGKANNNAAWDFVFRTYILDDPRKLIRSYPPAYDRPTMIVAGRIWQDGGVDHSITNAGAIVSSVQNANGEYTVTFADGTFSQRPIITVTAEDAANGDRFRNVVILDISTTSLHVQIKDKQGDDANTSFHFIAIGEQ